MNIVQLISGAGGMYCGSCLHGNTLATALQQAGENVRLVPLYTPIRTDEEDASEDCVFFGGVNVYLQQQSFWFRHTPRFVDWLFDRPALLRWATRRSRATRPEHLGKLTVSILRGEEGRQCKELAKLVAWLAKETRPDVVHLSNALLAGLAREIKQQLHVPVVCALSGEDAFLEKIPRPHYDEARAVLRERAADFDAMIAMNGYYADFMAEYLDVPRERIHVVRPGLNLDGHAKPEDTREYPSAATRQEVVVGYLGRICPDKGLHLLAESLPLLAEDDRLPPVRVEATGYLDEADRPYLEGIEKRLVESGLSGRFTYRGELDRPAKIAMLQSLDLLSLPAVYPESKGLPVLEAWANGIPAVLSDLGAFPEMVEETGGGILHEPSNPKALAAAIHRMVLEDGLANNCGRQAQRRIHQEYHAAAMAERTLEVYAGVVAK